MLWLQVLPPYSSDLNPIEKFCANMRRWIEYGLDIFTNLKGVLFGFFGLKNLD
jgi:transposase